MTAVVPCQRCAERAPGCHSTCQRYAEYRNRFDEAAKKRAVDAAVTSTVIGINDSNNKRIRRLIGRTKGELQWIATVIA